MLKLKAYAKINLSLKILGKRPDGYHEIESVMQSVSLHDLITLESISSGIQLATSNLRLPIDHRNLAYRAAELFLERVTSHESRVAGLKIYLEKNIPLAAGLAGGSADAAGVLFGLNKLCGNPMSKAELMKLGEQIGSDVPFCLTGGTCLVKGRGEIVERLEPGPKTHFIVICSDFQVSTRWVYEEYDRSLKSEILNPKQFQNSKSQIQNNLEPVVMGKYPLIQAIKEKLLQLGCESAQMSGSGPSVFGMVKNVAQGQTIVSEMRKTYPKSFLVTAVDRGVGVKREGRAHATT